MDLSEEMRLFIDAHRDEDVSVLALQGAKFPGIDLSVAVTQIAGRQVAARKIPSWHRVAGLLYPPRLSLEQCSSEATAAYKASLLNGTHFVDLTGGLGVDCAFISRRFLRADYVERESELCKLASHNFSLLGLGHIQIHHGDGVEYLRQMPPVDCLYLDPSRRNAHGGKVVAISDCEPDVKALEPLLVAKAETVWVKLSPMLDLSLALNELKTVCEIYVVAVNNECKELLLCLRKPPVPSEVTIHCSHLLNNGEAQHYAFTPGQERMSSCTFADEPDAFLYEPNVAMLKAGAFRSLTQAFPVGKLQVNSHLYTSSVPIPDFPGRGFRVERVSGFGKKDLKELLQDTEQANLTTRNFPLSVAELRKRLKLKEGGEHYLFATTLRSGRKVLIKAIKM